MWSRARPRVIRCARRRRVSARLRGTSPARSVVPPFAPGWRRRRGNAWPHIVRIMWAGMRREAERHEVPGPVMVWTDDLLTQSLDQAAEHAPELRPYCMSWPTTDPAAAKHAACSAQDRLRQRIEPLLPNPNGDDASPDTLDPRTGTCGVRDPLRPSSDVAGNDPRQGPPAESSDGDAGCWSGQPPGDSRRNSACRFDNCRRNSLIVETATSAVTSQPSAWS